MRRLFTILGVFGLLQLAIGCQHVGGKCDCTTHPGDASLYAPTNNYRPLTTTTAPSYEQIGVPKEMPKK